MADLLTHALVPWLLVVPKGGPERGFWALQGGVLPDLLGRVPAVLLVGAERYLEPGPRPWLEASLFGLEVLHSPLGLLPALAAVALALPARLLGPLPRHTILGWMGLGAATHLLLDAMQHHLSPSYAFFWPISDRAVELGWIGTEDTLWLGPVLLGVAVVRGWKSGR